jgi:hypothetical protein
VNRLLVALAAVPVALITATAVPASISLTSSGNSPTLRVDAHGDAEVGWTVGGARQYIVVPPHGLLTHSRLSAPDVSKKAPAAGLANALLVRSGPGGTTWALQRWQVAGKPPEIHLARWKGAPTLITLAFDGTKLSGRVMFQGKPVTGTSPTNSGKRERIYVYLACSGCGGATGWRPMLGVAPQADGSFSVAVRPAWIGSQYRASVAGPNIGSTLAPDAQVVVAGRSA